MAFLGDLIVNLEKDRNLFHTFDLK